MDRKERILKFANKEMLGIEIAPYFTPIAPKKDGWNCLSVDIFDTDSLIALAAKDPDPFVNEKVKNIENVDIVTSATELLDAIKAINKLGQFDYICSSHNFEHLPNPVKFLKACGEVLKTNGYLSMAIPNKRHTFDYAKPLTGTKDILRLYLNDYSKPDRFNLFESVSSHVEISQTNKKYVNTIEDAYEQLLKYSDDSEYIDAHVTIFTPESFLNIINDLIILELIPLVIVDIHVEGIEFIVHFSNIGYENLKKNKDSFIKNRNELLETCYKN